jgi:hypothetical protein
MQLLVDRSPIRKRKVLVNIVTDYQSYAPWGHDCHSWTVDHYHNCGDGVCYVKEMKMKPL